MPDDNRSDRGAERPSLYDAIREMAAQDREALGEHPDPVTLLDYHEGKLPAAATERLQEHLALCPECSQTVLDFAEFPHLEPRTEAHRLTPADVERQRRALATRLETEARPSWQRHELLLPLAAAFLLAAVGLGVWGARLQSRLAGLEGPRGDEYVLGALLPEGSGVRGGEPRKIPSWARRVHVYLSLPPGEGELPAYEVDAVSEDGHRLLSGFRVERSPEGIFVLVLPRDELAEGKYRFDLYGIEEGARRKLATYRVAIGRREG